VRQRSDERVAVLPANLAVLVTVAVIDAHVDFFLSV
jgi:hypothetical protein